MPVAMLPKFLELPLEGASDAAGFAFVMDLREKGFLSSYRTILGGLHEKGYPIEIVFLEADRETLLKRYSQSRRQHPLAREGRTLSHAIEAEKEKLEDLRGEAEYVIDTSQSSVHDLKARIQDIAKKSVELAPMRVNIMSFGFKFGSPREADLIMDVRFLPNPYFEPSLKLLSGETEAVQSFVLNNRQSRLFLDKFLNLLDYLLVTLVVFYGAATIVGESMPTRKMAYVNAASPAGIGGLQSGDIITAIDKKTMLAWADVKKAIVESKGKTLTITVDRANHEIDLSITPIFKKYRASMTKIVQEYQVGIKVASLYSPLTPDEAIVVAGQKMIQLSYTMIKSLGLLISGQVPIETVGGPILMAYQADYHARKGAGALIMFVAIISLSLAIINLLPIPMLDGGILFFLLIEVFFGRPLTIGAQLALNKLGLIIILMMVAAGLYFDSMRLLEGDSAGPQAIEGLRKIK